MLPNGKQGVKVPVYILTMKQVREYVKDVGAGIDSMAEVSSTSFSKPLYVYMPRRRVLYLGELAGGRLGS